MFELLLTYSGLDFATTAIVNSEITVDFFNLLVDFSIYQYATLGFGDQLRESGLPLPNINKYQSSQLIIVSIYLTIQTTNRQLVHIQFKVKERDDE